MSKVVEDRRLSLGARTGVTGVRLFRGANSRYSTAQQPHSHSCPNALECQFSSRTKYDIMLEVVIRGRSACKPVKSGVYQDPSPMFDVIRVLRTRHKICVI
jgi:hypothetical protein